MLDRLPSTTRPRQYRLFLEPDMERWTFNGHVDIDIDIHEAVDEIALNAVDLNVRNAVLDSNLVPKISVEDQVILFTFPQTIKGAKRMSIDFDGTINENPGGFFRNRYRGIDGSERYMLATQMQPADCRRLLPCFDEPAFKATFDVSVAADPALVVLGNGPVQVEEIRSDGKIVTHFDTTPQMCTYLLAVVVGDLRCVESHEFRVPVRGWATPGREKELEFGLKTATRVLTFYEDLFGIPYPLPKVDLIAAPNHQGAMEDWGAVIFMEDLLLWDPKRDSFESLQTVGTVVMHELAHQWFGNLVTMEWWDGLWLNEGFATWIEMYAAEKLFPDWKMWDRFVGPSALQAALSLDSLRSSHPIEVPLKKVADISQIFDAITYSKGACVIRMLVGLLGEDEFFRGLRSYLSRYSYSNATTRDLWIELGGQELADVMQQWTRQQGFPVLLVSDRKRMGDDTVIEVAQQRFLATNDVSTPENYIYPLRIAEKVSEKEYFLSGRQMQLVVPEKYKLNADNTCIARICYPPAHLDLLVQDPDGLTVQDRIGLVADAAALSGSFLQASQFFEMAQSWRTETEPLVLSEILRGLSRHSELYRFDKEFSTAFRHFHTTFVMSHLGPHLGDILGSSISPELLSQLFGTAVQLEVPEVIQRSLQLFRANGADLSPLLRASVFRAVARHGTAGDWDSLSKIPDSTTGVPHTQAVASMGTTKNSKQLKEVLDRVISGGYIEYEVAPVIATCVRYNDNALIVWGWIKHNWHSLIKKFPLRAIGSATGRMLALALPTLCCPDLLDDMEKFFADNETYGIDKTVDQSLDIVRAGVQAVKKDREDAIAWLRLNGYSL